MQFYNKTTKREYNALVWGIVEEDEGTITGNIGRNPKDRMQMAVMSDPTQGKHAVTHYQVLERLGYVTLVKCVLVNRTYPPDPCTHEAHRTCIVQRRTLRWP